MLLKQEFKSNNVVKSTLVDNIDKVDEGLLDDGTQFINIYKRDRKRDDDFEMIKVIGMDLYLMSDQGKTIQIYRSKKY